MFAYKNVHWSCWAQEIGFWTLHEMARKMLHGVIEINFAIKRKQVDQQQQQNIY